MHATLNQLCCPSHLAKGMLKAKLLDQIYSDLLTLLLIGYFELFDLLLKIDNLLL